MAAGNSMADDSMAGESVLSGLRISRWLLACALAAICCWPLPGIASLDDADGISSSHAVEQLAAWLQKTNLTRETLSSLNLEAFSSVPLNRRDALVVADLLWQNRSKYLRAERAAEMKSRSITLGDKTMPFWFKVFGTKPGTGHSLFISMHGGGGAPAQVNDQQYENQKRLYQPAEGIYLVPRAPTNSWNLWHEAHIDDFFDRLITNMIVLHDVNPDRVYIMGYSAGGDGVYQLAPRICDRLAAASMMAGHPNETQPDGLRNIGFAIHMGAEDSAYNRNRIAGEWKQKLSRLQQADPDGYEHHVELHSGRGHWMNLDDAVAVSWMARFSRRRFPRRIVWNQDDVFHDRCYWLKTDYGAARDRAKTVAEANGNTVRILEAETGSLTVLIHDELLDMNDPVTVEFDDTVLFQGRVARTVGVEALSLLDRDEPGSVGFGQVQVSIPQPK